ncbi:MAG: hypothetical protein QNJ31_01670 [Candidatus Caenarcaniphilales bacterium]|nr:hypothetical protein [Candidatus Caenarcaniphilales bacterium]
MKESSLIFLQSFLKSFLFFLIICFSLIFSIGQVSYSKNLGIEGQVERYQLNLQKLTSSKIGQRIKFASLDGRLSGQFVINKKLKLAIKEMKREIGFENELISDIALLKKFHREIEKSLFAELVNSSGIVEAESFILDGNSIEFIDKKRDLAFLHMKTIEF